MITTQVRDDATEEDDAKARLNVQIFRTLMAAKNIPSVAELSRRTGVSKSTIFRLLGGEFGTRMDTAKALAKELDTTVGTLFAEGLAA